MILALCVDDEMGLRFNRRRQSRDAAVISNLLESAKTLWIHPDSGILFPADSAVYSAEDYLEQARDGDWCFAEDDGYWNYKDKIEKIILYRWNRVYPRDLVFSFPGQWQLLGSEDFPGSSHEKITREVYIR